MGGRPQAADCEGMMTEVAEWLARYLPPRQEPGDYTVQDGMRLSGFKSFAGARRWLDTIPELKRIDGAILLNGRRGSVWRPTGKR